MIKNWKAGFLLAAVLLSAYFLSQSGFINCITEGQIHSATFDYYRMETSSDPQYELLFHGTYAQEQDVFSAVWFSKYANASSKVYSDSTSGGHVLISEGLVPKVLILPLTNISKPEQGNFVYLGTLNIVNGLVPVLRGLFNSSEVSSSLNGSDLVYSNGDSEIWSAPESG